MLSLVGDHVTCECTCALTTELALVIWEYFITLASEVDLFWRKSVTATSMLFVATRWIMLATVLLEIAPNTEARFESMPLLLSQTLISSPVTVKPWVGPYRFSTLLGSYGLLVRKLISLLHCFSAFSILHSILRHTSICNMAKLYMGLCGPAPGNHSCSNRHSKLTYPYFA